MSTVTCRIAIFARWFRRRAQPEPQQSDEGGLRLHQWAVVTDSWRKQHGLDEGERNADSEVVDDVLRVVGAY
jgi:hypothetical protein